MKKKILAIALAVCMLTTAVIGTLAYFTDKETATNTFTVGNVQIQLTEPAWTAEGGGAAQAAEAYPGEALAKDPTVENTGANPCMVLVKVVWPNLGDGNGKVAFRNSQYAIGAANTGWTYAGVDTAGASYFYYNKPLAAGETTDAPAFSSIVIPTELSNDTSGTPSYDVVVTAYAVQAQGIFPSYSTLTAGNADFALHGTAWWAKVTGFFADAFQGEVLPAA